jgi:hypothetical protein
LRPERPIAARSAFVQMAPLLQMGLRARVEPAASRISLFRSGDVKSERANNGRLHCRVSEGRF